MRAVLAIGMALAVGVFCQTSAARTPEGTRVFLPQESPVAVVLADFDGDAVTDIATANLWRSVSILRGDGTGRFRRGVTYAARGLHETIAAADLDGDGRPDLVTGEDGGTATVLLNDGSGGLRPAVAYSTKLLTFAIALGDLDGDGHLDLVTTGSFTGEVSVFLGRGDGVFMQFGSYRAASDLEDVDVGDVDADGHADVVATADEEIVVLSGFGDGTLDRPRVVGRGQIASEAVLVDLDMDRDLDLAWADY